MTGPTRILKYRGKPILEMKKVGVADIDDCPYYEVTAMHRFAEELRGFKDEEVTA